MNKVKKLFFGYISLILMKFNIATKSRLFNKFGSLFVISLIVSFSFYSATVFAEQNGVNLEFPISITNISEDLSGNIPIISFETNAAVIGSVKYWTDSASESSKDFTSDSPDQHEYLVELIGLDEGFTYFYYIEVCDLSGNRCSKSDIKYFIYGDDNNPPSIEGIQCPLASNKRIVIVGGITKPLSNVRVIVNDIYRFSVQVSINGLLSIDNVPLSTQQSTNLKLEIEDLAGNTNIKECDIVFDGTPPNIEIEEFPLLTNENHVHISLTTNKPVKLEIYRFLDNPNTPPLRPSNLREVSASDEKIEIAWDAPSSEDIVSYVVYRNNVPIALLPSSQLSYEDNKIISGRPYSYKIQAIDSFCNEGILSETLIVSALQGNHFSKPPEEVTNFCSKISPLHVEEIDDEFSGPLTLRNGLNQLLFKATDAAGNIFEREYRVFVDNTLPEFIDLNLDDFSGGGVYSPYVAIAGQVSKNATINITVNEGKSGERSYIIETTDSGHFSEQVDLARSFEFISEADTEGVSASFDRSDHEVPNTIKVVATDFFGNEVSREGIINFMVCDPGDGDDLDITFSPPMPNELIPRHLLEGVAVLGFSYDISVRGFDDESVTINHVSVTPMPLARFQARNYNLNWIRDNPIPVTEAGDFGYVQLRLKVPDSEIPYPDGTTYDNEVEIAKTNEGRCFGSELSMGVEGGMDGLGCVKLPLIFEVQYTRGDGTQLTQKVCLDRSVHITPRLFDPSTIPWLEETANFLEFVADTADDIRDFLETPLLVSIIGCVVSFGLDFIYGWIENIACLRAIPHINTYPMVLGADGYTVQVGDGDQDEADFVQACYNAKVVSESLYRASQQVCRRVMCGSIPSFEKYVYDNKGSSGGLSLEYDGSRSSSVSVLTASFSYCNKRHGQSPGVSIYANRDGSFPSDFLNEKLKHEDTYRGRFGTHERVVANFKHVDGKPWAEIMSDYWCEEEYYYIYRPYCWLKNPYKESLCTAYRINRDADTSFSNSEAIDSACGGGLNILNRASSFASEALNKLNFCSADQAESFGRRIGDDTFWIDINNEGQSISKKVFLLRSEGTTFVADQEGDLFRVTHVDQEVLARDGSELTINTFSSLSRAQCDVAATDQTGESFENLACLRCAAGPSGNPCCPRLPGRSTQMPPSIATHICGPRTPENQYIIDPTSSIISSAACVCLSSFDSYLAQISLVSRLLADCFRTIEETGEGSAGRCQQAVTEYICDTIYWAFGCFTKYAEGGIDVPDNNRLTIGDVTNAASLAGARTRDRISSDYGDDAMFKHLFGERNLFNTVCLFAFGYDWPSNFFESALEAARDSTPIKPIITCGGGTRRFQGFNPVSGVASYIYDLAPVIVSGAPDTEYHIELVCGANGDCSQLADEKKFRVTRFFGSGNLGRHQTLDKQEFVIVNEQSDPNGGFYRYDTVNVIVRYTNSDGEVVVEDQSCSIRDVGGQPPAFCQIDPLDFRFGCRVVGTEGSIDFARLPEPVKQTLYLKDGDNRVSFKQYMVRVLSRPGQPQPYVKLRISVTDNNGNPVRWSGGSLGSGRAVQDYEIRNTDMASFGEGEGNFNVPSFTVSEGAITGGTGQCQIFNKDNLRIREISCSGNFDAFKFEREGTNIRITKGNYIIGENQFHFTALSNSVTSSEFSGSAAFNFRESNYEGLSGDSQFTLPVIGESEFPLYIRTVPQLRPITYLNVEFSLLDEDGNVIHSNGRLQQENVLINLKNMREEDDISEPSDSIVVDSDTIRIGHEVTCFGPSCYCGSGGSICEMGQKCCARNREEYSGIGYCIDNTLECDRHPPILSDIDVKSVSYTSSIVRFDIDNVIDETQTISGYKPGVRLFMRLRYVPVVHEGQASTQLPYLAGEFDTLYEERDQDGFFTTAIEDSERDNRRRHVYNNIVLRGTIDRDGCYDVYFSAIDLSGNIRPFRPVGTPDGKLIVAEGGNVDFESGEKC